MASTATAENKEEEEKAIIFLTDEHRVEWSYEATKELLKLYDEKADLLETGIISKQRRLFQLISKDLINKGHHYTPAQCENKWKTLKRNFRSKMDKLERFGSCKRPCPFEREILEILNKRPNESFTRTMQRPQTIKLENDSSFNINIPPGFETTRGSQIEFIQEKSDMSMRQPEATYLLHEPSQLIDEVLQIKTLVTRNGKMNVALQRKIIEHLESSSKKQAQQLELEETTVMQQKEMIKQMKLQTEMLKKLLEKIG